MEYIKDGKPIKYKMEDIIKTLEPDEKMIFCRKCGCSLFYHEDHQKDLHGLSIRCAICGDHQWMGRIDKVKRKNPSHKAKHTTGDQRFCYLCQMTEDELKKVGQHLTVDHILEIQNGGEDVFENTILICNSCHYLKNAVSHKTTAIRKILK